MKLIKAQERIAGRPIPFAVLFTRSNPAIQPKTQRHIEERFPELSVPVLETRLFDREAFRAIFSFGGTLSGLSDKGVGGLPAALANARDYAAEVVERLRAARRGGRCMSGGEKRADPFAGEDLDLSGFNPIARRPIAPRDQIRVVSEAERLPEPSARERKPQQQAAPDGPQLTAQPQGDSRDGGALHGARRQARSSFRRVAQAVA